MGAPSGRLRNRALGLDMTPNNYWPYTVTVSAYRLAPRVDATDTVEVYSSRHRSPHAAGRRLASIIAGESAVARTVRSAIPRDYAGRYLIATRGAEALALIPFRARYCEGGAR